MPRLTQPQISHLRKSQSVGSLQITRARDVHLKTDFGGLDADGKLDLLNYFEVRYNYYGDDIKTAYDTYPSYGEANTFLEKFANLEEVCEWVKSTDPDQATGNLF